MALLHALYDEQGLSHELDTLLNSGRITVIRNKADLSATAVGLTTQGAFPVINLSAKHLQGVDILRAHLKEVMGFDAASEGAFGAQTSY